MERTVIALGFFDGVHRGHGALLQKTAERACALGAEPAVFTFDRPPKEVVTGLGCDIIPEVVHDGITVSSTYIRTLIEAGDVERAAEFLGHRHCLSRTVEHGQRIGRTIGIPTVNLTMPPRVLVPAHGVYITRVYLPDGRSFAGVTNVGTRPTVSDSDAVSVETFLLDFDGDLYGQAIRLDFCRRLRGEQKFDSLEALRQGIQRNIAQTRAYFRGEA